MHLLKRSIIFQIALFTFFFFFGADYILRQLIKDSWVYRTVEIVFLSLVVIGGIVCVIRTKKEDYVIVDKVLLNVVRIALYGVGLGLIIGLVGGVWVQYQAYFLIIAGAVMALSSLVGLYTSLKIIQQD